LSKVFIGKLIAQDKEYFLNRSDTKDFTHNIQRQVNSAGKSFGTWLHDLWKVLPSRDGQSLLKYIVYRLEDSDNISISARRKKFLFYTKGILLFAAAVSLTVLLTRKFFLPSDTYWVSEATHTLFETFSGFIAIIIGIILSWEYSTSGKKTSSSLSMLFFQSAFSISSMPSLIIAITCSSGITHQAPCLGPFSFLFQCLFIVPINLMMTSWAG